MISLMTANFNLKDSHDLKMHACGNEILKLLTKSI